MVMQNIILILIVITIILIPLIFIKGSEFGGADGEASDVIAEMNEDFKPWVEPIISPPGGETESLLFALQASIGSGVILFIIGYLKGKSDTKKLSHSKKI